MTYVPTKTHTKVMSSIDNNASFDHTLSQINHYQKKLEKYASMGETDKLLCCIHKLKYLPVTVSHLERTGVGKSINSLRHTNGIIGEKAKALVHKWKVMVAEEEMEEQAEEQEEYSQIEEPKVPPKPLYSNATPSSVEPEEYDNPSDEGNHLQIQEEVEENPASAYNPGGAVYHENEEESFNGYDPRTSREDYLSIGVDTTQATYQPSSRNNNDSTNNSPERTSLPNGDHHSGKLKKDKSSKSKEELRHKKKKHKSRREHEEKNKSGDSGSSSSHKKSKHKSSKSKDKRKEREREKDKDRDRDSSKSKHRSVSSHKEPSSHSKDKETTHHKYSPSYGSPTFPSPTSPDSNYASPNYSLPSNSAVKKTHRKPDEKQEVSPKKGRDHSLSKDKESSSKNNRCKETGSHKSSRNSTKEEEHRSKKRKRKEEIKEAESTSGFEAALMGMEETSSSKKKKKKKSKEKDKEDHQEFQNPSYSKPSKSSFPTMAREKEYLPQLPSIMDEEEEAPRLMTHYKPLPQVPQRIPSKDPYYNQKANEEGLNFMLKSRNKQQRRIYAGKATTLSFVPSLFDICIRVLQENIDALEVTGGIPFSILRPVLEKASPNQLFTLEDYNPYLLEDTDVLWASHCRKSFKNKTREDMETWRELFIRSTDENQEKLSCVTENLQKKYITKAIPKRTTQLAFINVAAKPPRSIARVQARLGTASTSSAQVKPVKQDESQKAGSSGNPVPRPDRPFPNKPTAVKKPKMAPLMGKARQLMKKVCRR